MEVDTWIAGWSGRGRSLTSSARSVVDGTNAGGSYGTEAGGGRKEGEEERREGGKADREQQGKKKFRSEGKWIVEYDGLCSLIWI